MKPKIHPNYRDTKVVCACGNTFQTRSCYRDNELDTSGRVDRFQKKYAKKP